MGRIAGAGRSLQKNPVDRQRRWAHFPHATFMSLIRHQVWAVIRALKCGGETLYRDGNLWRSVILASEGKQEKMT